MEGTLSREETKENYGFKSRTCPPPVKEMENFENDLVEMAQNVEFREVNNAFQREMKKDMKDVRNSNKAFIPADKTRNIYEMDKQTHEKLLHENITKTYRKTNDTTYREINSEAKKIATKLEIDNKVPVLAKKNAFISKSIKQIL